jgi:hypothetical protein
MSHEIGGTPVRPAHLGQEIWFHRKDWNFNQSRKIEQQSNEGTK